MIEIPESHKLVLNQLENEIKEFDEQLIDMSLIKNKTDDEVRKENSLLVRRRYRLKELKRIREQILELMG
jgi:hypothetical protein